MADVLAGAHFFLAAGVVGDGKGTFFSWGEGLFPSGCGDAAATGFEADDFEGFGAGVGEFEGGVGLFPEGDGRGCDCGAGEFDSRKVASEVMGGWTRWLGVFDRINGIFLHWALNRNRGCDVGYPGGWLMVPDL